MASQQPPARPWFRLSSMARPAPAPAPTPQAQPPAPQPRPPLIRPAFPRTFSTVRPQPPPPPPPPQAPISPPPPRPSPPPAAASPPSHTAPPPRAAVAPPTSLPPTATIVSVPTSPIIKGTATPSPKASITSTILPIASSSVPPSPKPIISTPSSSLPTSPAPKPLSPFLAPPPPPPPPPSPVPTAAALPFTATSSPRVSPPPKIASPQIKPLTPPPSPLILPPAQLKSHLEHQPNFPPEAEKKTVVVQETIEKTKVMPRASNGDHQRYVGESHSSGKAMNGKQDGVAKDKGNHKKFSDSEEFGMRVITMAGENKGAIMELSPSRKKHEFGGNPRAWSNAESSEEGRVKSKDKSHKTIAYSSPPLNAFMNSNVQGVNNSILLNSSFTHHDPGVHFSLSRKTHGNGNGKHIKDP